MKRLVKTKKINERGIATVEAALLLSIFIVFMTYCVGTFGVIHTGILNSISARAYAFETIRNRASVVYFRDSPGSGVTHTKPYGLRVHGVTTEKTSMSDNKWYITQRTLAQGREIAAAQRNEGKTDELYLGKREPGSINPAEGVWIKTVYGICLNFQCGGD